jgi:hypothetical protein
MVIDLQRLQVEFGGVVMGPETRIPIADIKGLGTTDLLEREYDNPNEDGRQFGREYRSGRTLEISATIETHRDEKAAWDLSSELEELFDADELRKTSRAVEPMRLRRPGKPTRVVYGRPDDFEADKKLAVVGVVPFEASFRCSDRKFYSDLEQSFVAVPAGSSDGYIVLDEDGNIPSPITTTTPGRRSTTITVGGTTPTWPVIRIEGPITNPSVTVVDGDGALLWRLAMEGSIGDGQVAELDTRPWSRQAALTTGSPVSGKLTRDSVLSRSTLPPGVWDVQVQGADMTGLARFTILWRDAYKTL